MSLIFIVFNANDKLVYISVPATTHRIKSGNTVLIRLTINAITAEAVNTVKKFIILKDNLICFKVKIIRHKDIIISIIRLDIAPPVNPVFFNKQKRNRQPAGSGKKGR